jgi:hypothetical protein
MAEEGYSLRVSLYSLLFGLDPGSYPKISNGLMRGRSSLSLVRQWKDSP